MIYIILTIMRISGQHLIFFSNLTSMVAGDEPYLWQADFLAIAIIILRLIGENILVSFNKLNFYAIIT